MTHALILQCVGSSRSHITAALASGPGGAAGPPRCIQPPWPQTTPKRARIVTPPPPPGNPLPHLLSAQPASTITSAHHAIIRLGRAPTHTHANTHTHTRSHARAQREHGQAAPIDRWAACGTRRSNPRPTGAALRDRQVSPPNVWITPKNPQGTQTMTDPHMVETWGRIRRAAPLPAAEGHPVPSCPCCPSSAATGSPI